MSRNSKASSYKDHPKTSVKYWEGAVFRPVYRHNGEEKLGRTYCVKIAHKGKRQTFNLNSAEKSESARKAKEIYLSLISVGLDDTLAIYKPKKAPPKSEAERIETVGGLITSVEKISSVSERTAADNARAFRFIAGAISRIYIESAGSRKNWKSLVDATKLSELTPEKVLSWKTQYIREQAGDAVDHRSAKNTVNSIIRKAKSLLAKKIVPFLALPPDFVSPFAGVPFEPRQSMRYRSRIDLGSLVQQAKFGDNDKGLEPLGSEHFKIFVLAAMAGLRRNEIDKLEWSSFLWDEGLIRLETTATFSAKSEESNSDVAVDPEIVEYFKSKFTEADSKFVISSANTPKVRKSHAHYRCAKLFKELVQWLRKAGVESQKPIHTLRKEFGSLICENFGIFAASTALRHGDIHITTQHYVDSKKKIRPNLGGLLRGANE